MVSLFFTYKGINTYFNIHLGRDGLSYLHRKNYILESIPSCIYLYVFVDCFLTNLVPFFKVRFRCLQKVFARALAVENIVSKFLFLTRALFPQSMDA